MTIPADVLAILEPLVKEFEGCKLKSYLDTSGIWTIGYGATGITIGPTTVWTQEAAEQRLQVDLAARYSQLLQVSPVLAQATAARQAALTDFVYNLGIGTYSHSTLRGAVDVGAWVSVVTQLSLWTHSGGQVQAGLVRRRNREISLCQS